MLMTILSEFLWFCLILTVVRKLIVFIYSEEDLYSDEAIQKAKEKYYPPLSSLSFEQIMEYKAKEGLLYWDLIALRSCMSNIQIILDL